MMFPYFGQDSFIAYSYQQAMQQLKGETPYRLIVLLCELNYDANEEKRDMQELAGIDFAKKFRLNGINIPIVFVSFLSRKQVYANKPERGIVNTIGHCFLRLPCSRPELEAAATSIRPLNEIEAHDIIYNYCSLNGVVRALMHLLTNIKSEFLDGAVATEELQGKIRQLVVQLHQAFNESADSALYTLDHRFAEIGPNNIAEACRYIEDIGSQLIERKGIDQSERPKLKAKGKWKMLLLDDELTPGHPLFQRLDEREVDYIHVRSVEEGRAVVNQESKLSLVVSDYRLEEEKDGLKVHQPVQGYQFLKELIDDRPVYLRLAALSSLPRKFLIESFKYYGIRVEIFSKKDYFEKNNIDLLCDELVELGNENAEIISRSPRLTSETWQYFEPFYRYHRNSPAYVANENYISERAKVYCDGIQRGHYMFNLSGYKSLNLNGNKSKPENGRIFHIFLEKCICRRVALWYSQYNRGAGLKDVHMIIQGASYTGDFSAVTPRNQININLALSMEEYPWNMTIEEKRWLNLEMRIINTDDIEHYEEQLLNQLADQLTEWLEQRELKDDLNPLPAYRANFRMLKTFLYKLHLQIFEKNELIRGLEKLFIHWEIYELQKPLTKNAALFKSYVKYFRTCRLPYSKVFKQNAVVVINNKEEFCQTLLQDIVEIIPPQEHDDFKANVYIFYYNSQDGGHLYQTKREWRDALLLFHKEEMAKLKGDKVEFDEIKAYKALKPTDE